MTFKIMLIFGVIAAGTAWQPDLYAVCRTANCVLSDHADKSEIITLLEKLARFAMTNASMCAGLNLKALAHCGTTGSQPVTVAFVSSLSQTSNKTHLTPVVTELGLKTGLAIGCIILMAVIATAVLFKFRVLRDACRSSGNRSSGDNRR